LTFITFNEFLIAIFIIILLTVLTMVLPSVLESESLHLIIGWPFHKGICTIYSFFIFILFFVSIKNYGMPIYKDAYFGYKNYKSLTMETLITLGSVSSIIMSFYIFIEYFIIKENSDDDTD